jgi:hypothetical protein
MPRVSTPLASVRKADGLRTLHLLAPHAKHLRHPANSPGRLTLEMPDGEMPDGDARGVAALIAPSCAEGQWRGPEWARRS